MNLYNPPNEKDPEYIQYYSIFKIAAKTISPDAPESMLHDWMRAVTMKFPYFVNTNPRVMAIASMLSANTPLNLSLANDAIITLYGNEYNGKSTKIVLNDVDRYYRRLI